MTAVPLLAAAILRVAAEEDVKMPEREATHLGLALFIVVIAGIVIGIAIIARQSRAARRGRGQ